MGGTARGAEGSVAGAATGGLALLASVGARASPEMGAAVPEVFTGSVERPPRN
jgi:hypothetical protein